MPTAEALFKTEIFSFLLKNFQRSAVKFSRPLLAADEGLARYFECFWYEDDHQQYHRRHCRGSCT